VTCPIGTARHPQPIRLTAPAGQLLSAAKVCLRYPTAKTSLPGSGQVNGRISGFSGFTVVNDFDYSTLISLLPNDSAEQLDFTISFDRCLDGAGAPVPAPAPAEFECITTEASDDTPALIQPPTLVQCTAVTAP